MTRRHFEAIALVLRNVTNYPAGDEWTRNQLAREFAEFFATENPRFDCARFLNACGMEW